MTAKTSVIFRDFTGMEIRQDIDDEVYNITDLAKNYFKTTGKRKDINDFMNNKTTVDYISLLENLKTGFPVFKMKRGKYWGTRVNKELLIDFMMWISPEFKHMAITFVLQWLELSIGRKKIKEWYKKMSQAICEMWWTNYREEATLLNVLCTWSSAKNQRARLWIDKIKQMDELQIINASLIKAWLSLEERKNVLVKTL